MRKFIDANIIYDTKDMTKEEWLEKRKIGIGGSDASAVIGLSPYKKPISVYLDKVYDIKASADDMMYEAKNYKMELGNKLEEFVAREFTLKTGKKVRNINGILQNPKYPFAIANIDRAIVGEKAILECKVTNSYSKKDWIDSVPLHVQIQVEHYLAVTGATHAYVAALIGNEELRIHKITRDEETIDVIMAMEECFHREFIKGEKIPPPDGSNDYSTFTKEKYKMGKSESIVMYSFDKKLKRHDEIVKLIKELEIEKKAIEQEIQLSMGNYEVAYVGDRKITWKNQRKSRIDTKKLKEDYPELVEKYTYYTDVRVFRI